MKLGINASNIRADGGVIHLMEMLRVAHPYDYGFDQVIVWSRATLDRLEERPWLWKVRAPLMGSLITYAFILATVMLDRLVRQHLTARSVLLKQNW